MTSISIENPVHIEREPKQETAITVIIPAYNEEASLGRLITSLQKQQFDQPVRIIVSDNKSTDQTSQVARSFGAEVVDGSIPRSVGSARRRGAHEALSTHDGHVLLFVDADSIIPKPNYLASVYQRFKTHPETMVSFGPTEFAFSDGTVLKPPPQMLRNLRKFILWQGFKREGKSMREYINPPFDIFPGYNVAIRESAYTASGGFHDEDTQAEDVRLSLELQALLPKDAVYFNPEQVVQTAGRSYESIYGHPSLRRIYRTLMGKHRLYNATDDELGTTNQVIRDFMRRQAKPLERVSS